jgi:hypothetical protein
MTTLKRIRPWFWAFYNCVLLPGALLVFLQGASYPQYDRASVLYGIQLAIGGWIVIQTMFELAGGVRWLIDRVLARQPATVPVRVDP